LYPDLETKNLTGAVRYFDGLTNDARLVIDTLRSASKSGAAVVNYCRMTKAEKSSGLWQCTLSDNLTGCDTQAVSRCIINATGPWAQQIEHSQVKLRLTKGVHLVISRDRLPVPDAVVMTDGPRILFAIPWGERVILGTTDTDYEGRPEDVAVEKDDVDYVISIVSRAFPNVGLSKVDVISSWAGLRPLIADPKGGPSDISRTHEIRSPEPGWLDVAGGKLTTYRLMAQQTINQVYNYLKMTPPPCRTAAEPLLPPEETEGISSIAPPEPARELVQHFCRNEWAKHLDDVMIRRTSWAYYRLDAKDLTRKVADWMAEELQWDDERKLAEVKRCSP
jgi:glycerol-3-phosphate dehydrogenase